MNLLELNNLTLHKGDFQFDLTTFFIKVLFTFIHFNFTYHFKKAVTTKGQPFVLLPFQLDYRLFLYIVDLTALMYKIAYKQASYFIYWLSQVRLYLPLFFVSPIRFSRIQPLVPSA